MRKTRVWITAQTELCEGICSLWIKDAEMAREAKPGQFLSLYCEDGSRLLPRPVSICEIRPEEGLLRMVYRVAGAGTEEFSHLSAGDGLEVLGTLGNGYELREGSALLLGGGIGIPPMLALAKALCEKNGKEQVTAVLGYRDANTFLAEAFVPYAQVVIATEDGSVGVRGNVLDAVREKGICAEQIYACGPKPMLRGVKAYAREAGLPAQISLEERMACGIGACLACVCQSTKPGEHTHVNNVRICKDGPVFDAEEVEL